MLNRAFAQVSTASPGADKIKVTVKMGSMNFRLIPSGNLFSQYNWEADWGTVEPGGPDVVTGWDVNYVGGSKTGYNEYSLIDQANKVKPDGSFDGLRVWFGPPNPTTGFTNHGTSPFNYPLYPDTSRTNGPEYPITLVEFEECTPMDNVILHVWVAESDSSTANTAVGLLTGLAGVVLTGIGLAAEAPSAGTSTAIVSLGVGLIGLASGMISQNGDEDWGRASDSKNAPGRYTLTTANGKDGKVHLDWAIETKVIEKNSPDCNNQRTSLFIPGYDSSSGQALAYFGSMRGLVSQVPVMHDDPDKPTGTGTELAAYVMQAANSTQHAALASMPNDYASSLTAKAEGLALEGSYRNALDLYEAAFLATIESDDLPALNASASVSPGVMLSGSALSTASIKNTGESPISSMVVRNLEGDLKYVYISGWERKRLAHDTAILWTDDRPIALGESVSLMSMTSGEGDLLFRFGTNSSISSTLVAAGPQGRVLVDMIADPLLMEAGEPAPEIGRIEELAFPTLLTQGRTEEGFLSVRNVNNGYLQILVDTDLPFNNASKLVIVNKGTDQAAEFTINDSGQLVGRIDIPSDLDMELSVEVLHGAPAGVYEIAFLLHGQDGSIHDTEFAEVDVAGESNDPSPAQQGPPISAEPAEIEFTHKVGDTGCPQFIGTVFLNADGEGEWWIAGQPKWLTIQLEGEAAQFEFNCSIEDASTHAIEGAVVFVFEGEGDESNNLEVSIYGEIIGED